MESKILVCTCHDVAHQLVISHDDEYNEAYVHIHLQKVSFWRRLRYLFGKQSNCGAFEEMILNETHIPQIKDLLFRLEDGAKKK